MSGAATEALILRVAAQDRRALHELYLHRSDLLLDVLARMLINPAEAEDGLQEVFLRIWTRAPSFDPARGRATTWLIAIARNYAIDQRRKHRNVNTVDVETTAIADPGSSPEATHDARATARRVIYCLGTLNPEHAKALRAAYLDGQSYRDLAEHHGVPLNTIRTWLRRSLTKLRDCLTEDA